MRRSLWLLFALAGLAASVAVAGPDGDDLERNRRLLEKWKADPEHYQRLQHDLAAFQALPAERQERIRRLDRELHESDPTTGARLWGVLERYALWLERLPEEERRTVLEAPTPESRLVLIRGLRQHEWLSRLPLGLREKLQSLPAEQRAERMRELRLEERRQRVLWEQPFERRQGPIQKPEKPDDLPRDVQEFLRKSLLPRLSASEKRELESARGKWPQYPRLVARLAERHPVLPPKPGGEITRVNELPASMRPLLRFYKDEVPRGAQGKWPDFALAVTDLYRRKRPRQQPPPLGASKPDEFPLAVRAFLNNRLFPSLSRSEMESLKRLEGRWPDYPIRLLRLARQKHEVIPGMSLPGPPELWTSAFLSLHELSQEDRDSLNAIAIDNFRKNLKRMKEQAFRAASRPPRMGHKGLMRHGGR